MRALNLVPTRCITQNRNYHQQEHKNNNNKNYNHSKRQKINKYNIFGNCSSLFWFSFLSHIILSMCILSITSVLLVSDGQLKPRNVDFLRTKNRQEHRTSDYEIPNLIIRRGQQFDVSITFDRTFSCQDDDLVLKFVTGKLKIMNACVSL